MQVLIYQYQEICFIILKVNELKLVYIVENICYIMVYNGEVLKG